ncbi:phosphatidate cytidylyltransferase [Candidatus Babeliales bacterium]|nr:phosphatidate cytidylyltransferase [Candidatus Babeliales bacterium]
MNALLKNFLIRTITTVFFVVPAWYCFLYKPPLVTTIGLIILAAWIIFVELPCLVSPWGWQFYALALFYICFPFYVMIGMNQHVFFRFYLMGAAFWIFLHDTGAYVVGTLFGTHKMAPDISAGKTWEGFIGGFLAVAVWNMYSIISMDYKSLFTAQALFFVGFSITFTSVATLGDLFESSLKRRAGVKDSGWILPGHGGVLDRLDSLLFVVPLLCFYIAYTTQLSFPMVSFFDVIKKIMFPRF